MPINCRGPYLAVKAIVRKVFAVTFSLFDAFVTPIILRLDACLLQIAKAQVHCKAEATPEDDFLEVRFAPDMLPFSFQIKAMTMHSRWAVECLREGVFQSLKAPAPTTFAEAKDCLSATAAWMRQLERDDMDGLAEKPVRYQGARMHGDFDGAYFLMNFSVPNFYFHATTAYDLLRWKGVPIGKFDYLGALTVHENG